MTVLWYIACSETDGWARPVGMLADVPPVDRARTLAATGDMAGAARLFRWRASRALARLLPALAGGALVSVGTLRRVEAVWNACSRIMEGEFHRRLPVGRRRDEFDRLLTTTGPTLLHVSIEAGNAADIPKLLVDPVVLAHRFQSWLTARLEPHTAV